MTEETIIRPISGFLMAGLALVLIFGSVATIITIQHPAPIIGVFLGLFLLPGFFINYPNQSVVLILFGNYKGTVKANGFYWVNPFTLKTKISLRANNFDNNPIKVNDLLGNPIMIGAVVVWRVRDTYKAAFEVNDYREFVGIQSEAALRKMAGTYPYDDFEDEDHGEFTLREGGAEVNLKLEEALAKRLNIAGIEILEARISHLAYASEIAGAMLQRQQATAIVAARKKIVEGAVGMVEMALKELKKNNIVELDEEKKAAMVSNLLVVLCSDKNATPVVNAGTLNH
jgi:regulator of protease activity HflC (stomatin/prohibitin superfamily)